MCRQVGEPGPARAGPGVAALRLASGLRASCRVAILFRLDRRERGKATGPRRASRKFPKALPGRPACWGAGRCRLVRSGQGPCLPMPAPLRQSGSGILRSSGRLDHVPEPKEPLEACRLPSLASAGFPTRRLSWGRSCRGRNLAHDRHGFNLPGRGPLPLACVPGQSLAAAGPRPRAPWWDLNVARERIPAPGSPAVG